MSITFERTTDYALIRETLTHPGIYPHVIDDYSPSAQQFRANDHEAIWYMLARDGDELLGVFTLLPLNSICFEIHVGLLPTAWGKRAALAASGILQVIFDDMPCKRLVASIPAYNRRAIIFALLAGLKQYGVNQASFQRNGRLHDQILLGLSSEEYHHAISSH